MNDNDTFQNGVNNLATRLLTWASWNEFVDTIGRKNRYFQSDKVIKCLGEILPFNSLLNASLKLYRARIIKTELLKELRESQRNSGTGRITGLHKEQMGAPPDGKASNGRANPQGISYLYLASDPETACSEVKPNIYDLISVSEFKLKQNLLCIDFRKYSLEKQTHNDFFRRLQLIFSTPQKESDGLDYIITQYVSAFFQYNKQAGIIYSSSCNPSSSSYNVVLFNPESAECAEEYGNIYGCTKKILEFQIFSDLSYNDYQVSAGSGKLSDGQIADLKKALNNETN